VTTDATPHAVYVAIGATTASLEAIPLTGGAPITIAATLAQTDRPIVRGGVVAWYTAISADGVGTINLWTKAAGAKLAVATGSIPGVFAASKDGTRVAFSVDTTPAAGDPTATALAVTSSATPVATAVLTGTGATGNKMNIAAVVAENCPPDIAFEGNVFFGAYCTGTAATATNARLVTVPAAGGAPVVLIANSNGTPKTGILPSWQPDAAGAKLFVVGLPTDTTASQGQIVTVAGPTIAPVEGATDFGFMLNDGSAAIYKTATTMKAATAVATPVIKTLATGVKELLFSSADGTKMLVSTLDPAGTDELIDIRSIDSSTANQTPAPIVATATTLPLGLNGAASHAVYLTDLTATSGKLKSKPLAAGGAEKVLTSDAYDGYIPSTGSGVIVINKIDDTGDTVLTSLSHVDSVAGGTPQAISDSVPMDGGYIVSGKKLVYVRLKSPGGGLFVTDLP